MAKRIALITFGLCLLITLIGVWWSEISIDSNNQPSGESSAIRVQPINTNDLHSFIGAVDYVVVGKVLEQVGVEKEQYFGGLEGLLTAFKIEPIYNIKGELKEPFVLKQSGGVNRDGSVSVVMNDGDSLKVQSYPSARSLLLVPGYTYTFLLTKDKQNNYFKIPYHADFRVILSQDNASPDQLKVVALKDRRVYEFLAAYVNEIPKNANVMNRFDLLSESEKKIVFDKFSELIPSQSVPPITHPAPYDFSPPTTENSIIYCIDGLDNDKDGYIDIQDSECKPLFKENNAGLCRDTRENDFDGLIDAADPDCAPFYPQQTPPPPPPQPNPVVLPTSTSSTAP